MQSLINSLVGEYGVEASQLSIRLAIEEFRTIRRYPSYYSEEKILADMRKNASKIAMASVEIDSKEGVEGQTQHTESGSTRTYSKEILAYKSVVALGNPL